MDKGDYNSTGDYYNYVEPCQMTKDNAVKRLLRLYIHSVICILGLMGNILVIVTYAFYKKAKSMTDVYLLNMAIADMLFVAALPLIIYNEYNHWDMGTVACKILGGAYSVNLYSGMLLLACISTDRYIAIVLARRSFGSDPESCSTVALSVLQSGLLPCSCPSPPSSTTKATTSRNTRRVRVVLAVVAVFLACHLPYNVALLYETVRKFEQQLCNQVDNTEVAKTVTETVAFLHCCLNPFLYAFIGVRFRNHFRKIVSDLWCMGKRVLNPRHFSRATSEFNVSISRRSMDGYSNENSSFTM
ncbi:hypothetical protein UPYG_G00254760 [Umbra pygmaea]|uniref:G-protein coupled receptors family 1 profile domain-containing protein n=1 Tax=Umbra pygmaea TaxID=75934 RepID=A0ABD0W9R8_UMBPY